MMDNIDKKLKSIFETNGIVIFEDEKDDLLDLDSLRFISIIVEIEGQFNIIVPDEYLSENLLLTYSDFFNLVASCLLSNA